MSRRRSYCPECGPRACDATVDIDGNPIWECRNCDRSRPRRVHKRRELPEQPTLADLTPAQRRTVERVRETALRGGTYLGPEYAEGNEVKTFELRHNGRGVVDLHIVVGRAGDEGTMAALICRDRYHVFIGPRGGIWGYESRKVAKAKGKRPSTRRVRGFNRVMIDCRES